MVSRVQNFTIHGYVNKFVKSPMDRTYTMNLTSGSIIYLDLLLTLRVFLGLFFCIGAIRKIIHLNTFTQGVINYKILPSKLSKFVGILLPWVEIMLAILLFFGVAIPIVGTLSFALILTFIIAIEINLKRGRHINCNCHGIASTSKISQGTIIRNVFLLCLITVLIILSLYIGSDSLSSEELEMHFVTPDVIFLIFVTVFLFVTMPLIEWVFDINQRASTL